MHGTKGTPANLILDSVLIDMMLSPSVCGVTCVFGAGIECFLSRVSLPDLTMEHVCPPAPLLVCDSKDYVDGVSEDSDILVQNCAC